MERHNFTIKTWRINLLELIKEVQTEWDSSEEKIFMNFFCIVIERKRVSLGTLFLAVVVGLDSFFVSQKAVSGFFI